MHCPLYLNARRKHLFANGRPQLFHQIFNHPEHVCCHRQVAVCLLGLWDDDVEARAALAFVC
jgi:hypothetical protein